MKSLLNTAILLVVAGLATNAFAQSSPVALNEAPAASAEDEKDVAEKEKGDETEARSTPSKELSGCDAYIARVSRSAARKMLRALNTKEKLQTLELGEVLETELEGKRVSFRVFTEYEGRVAALFEPGTRTSWIVARSNRGPVVARIDWNGGCGVAQTELAYPDGPTIAFEPFRYWGARVQWRLPAKRDADVSLIEAIRRAAR